MKCFNCQGKGHMARQCPKPKRKRDATWFRDKVLPVEAQGSSKVLNEEELAFLADPGVTEGSVTQTVITHNAAYQVDDLDAYDFDCDEISTAKAVLISNLSSYESFSLSDNNIIPYSQYLYETQNATVHDTNSPTQQVAMILSVFERLLNQVTNYNKVNKDNLIANESLSAELERYKERVKLLEERQNIRPMLYDVIVIAKETNVISIADLEETLMLEEESRSKMLLKQSDPMARRVNGHIKCNLTGHVHWAKAQVIPSLARERNLKYKYPPLHSWRGVQVVATTDDSPAIPEHITVETPMNMSPANKAHFEAEKEAIHLILTGIGDEIYSTVDACQTAQEMWEAIERLQQEVNELRAERLARNANPLALVATTQANQDPYYHTSKSQKSYAPSSKPSILTRSHTTTRHKGKEIAKPITPPFESASKEDIDLEQAQRNKDMQKNLALIAKTVNVVGARKNVGSPVVQQSGIQCFNCKEFGHFAKECRKPKRVKDSAYHKEKMLLCKQAEKGVPLQAEQYDWLADTDEEIDEQKLEAHYNYMAKIQEVPTADTNICLVETDDSNVIHDLPDMCDDDIQNDQNDVESDDERVALANLIANLKLNVDENKKIQNKLKKANTTLAQELKECKTILAKTIKTLGESNSFRDKIVDNAWIKHSKDQLRALTAQDMEILIQTCFMPLTLKTQNDSFVFVHELKQEMHADLKYVESLEKEIDKLKSDKAEFSNMYDMILQECVSNEVMCTYLLSLSDLDAPAELQCLYLHKVKECDCLAQKLLKQTESVCKEVHTELLQCFAKVEKHSIYLEIALQKCKEQKLIEKGKGKSVETKFDKPSIVPQPNAQRIPKPSVLEGLSKPVTVQTLPQTARQAVSNTNVLKPRMYQINNMTTQTRAPQSPQTVRNTNPCVSTSTGVNHKTNVSRPQHRSNQLKDKVMPNNSQLKLKKTQVEEHPRISSISNKIKSVTVCNDSLNSKTFHVNAVCATCEKCLVDSDHFACVTKMLNDVNARTKNPNVVPTSTRKAKGHANTSVATPHKKKVTSKLTNQKLKSYYGMLYEKTSKAWKWWIEQQCPL
nr:hypothetical protein [Tanacetum cinerariifolium]